MLSLLLVFFYLLGFATGAYGGLMMKRMLRVDMETYRPMRRFWWTVSGSCLFIAIVLQYFFQAKF
jgi:hypothetical protein